VADLIQAAWADDARADQNTYEAEVPTQAVKPSIEAQRLVSGFGPRWSWQPAG
jgi:hypothetical protein